MFDNTEISKIVGWDQRREPVPGRDKVNLLICKARHGCKEAFITLYTLRRFGVPINKEEVERMNLLCKVVVELLE